MRTAGLDLSQGPTAAKYIMETVKPQRIAIIHDKQQYGEGLARSVQESPKKGGANIVFFDGITAGEKTSAAGAPEKENIDFVYYGGYYLKWVRCCAGAFRRAENRVYGPGRRG